MASKDRIRRKLRVPDEIVALIIGCHPQLKRKIRAGLRQIVTEPEAGKSLKDELEGLISYRISRFRIIYRISSKQAIDIVAVGPRKSIYEETYRILKRNTSMINTDCAQIVPVNRFNPVRLYQSNCNPSSMKLEDMMQRPRGVQPNST